MIDLQTNVAALVLAAGQSKRMGAENKLLIDLSGKTLLQRVLTHLEASVISEVIVVTGYQSDLVYQSISNFNVNHVENPDYHLGLSSSIKVGINSVSESMEAVLVCHGDMPFISSDTVNQIVKASVNNEKIIMPTYFGQVGNPLLWPACYFKKLRRLSGDTGAKAILNDNQDSWTRIEVNNIGILLDIDDLQTLESLRSRFEPLGE